MTWTGSGERGEAPGVFSATMGVCLVSIQTSTNRQVCPQAAATTTATANGYRVPVAVIPSGKISFQAVMKRFISSSVPIDTRK